MSGERPDLAEIKVLRFLRGAAGQGGFTSGVIARETGLGSDRRMMAITRANVLVPMVRKGWLAPLDDQKPVVFTATDEGRAVLARHDKGTGQEEEPVR